MKKSDQIIIEELKRIVFMQAQELAKIPLLIARIEVLERELERYTTRKDSNNSSLPPSKDENRPRRTSSLREKGNRKAGGQPGHEGKTFLYHPMVPPDNNGSERAIRNVKVKQKISGQFKILSAAENFAILRSIIDTAMKNNQNVVEALNVIADYKRI